jgi:hypothetical protein
MFTGIGCSQSNRYRKALPKPQPQIVATNAAALILN